MRLVENLRTPLSEREIVLEHGDETTVKDSLARLHGAGLIHRCGEFIFSSAAARRASEILL